MDLSALNATVATTRALLAQFKTSIDTLRNPSSAPQISSSTSTTTAPATPSAINALDLAYDAAKLVRAHATKLSLLIINKPFTPSAICKVLRELGAGPLPALATAVELCRPEAYTAAMHSELRWAIGRVLAELGTLINDIPLDEAALGQPQTQQQQQQQSNGGGGGGGSGKGTLASTGVVWQACDVVADLRGLGVAGLVVRKVEGYQALLKDALEELKEWGEESSDDDDEDDNDNDGDDVGDDGHEDGHGDGGGLANTTSTSTTSATESHATDDPQAIIDSMFASSRHIPRDDPARIRDRLESSLKRLKLMILLYAAVIKRRFRTLPPLPRPPGPFSSLPSSSVSPAAAVTAAATDDLRAAAAAAAADDEYAGIVICVDEVLAVLRKIPALTDELASAFYELDAPEIDRRMDECFFAGFAAAELLMENWERQKDEFSAWAYKFQTAMKRSFQFGEMLPGQ